MHFTYRDQPLTSAYSETFPQGMHKRNAQMARAGCQLFFLIVRGGWDGEYVTSWFWRGDGVYGDESDRPDDLTLDRQADAILAANSEAVFMVRWCSEVPGDWARRHPDELQAAETHRLACSSYASDLALEGRCELARRVVAWCESRSWGDRVIGYLPFGQDEGTHNLSMETLFDQSPAMLRHFVARLRHTYGSDQALRGAWGDDQVTIATATLPSDSEWRAARRSWQHWPEPAQLRRYQDYFSVYRHLLYRQRTAEMAAVKAASTRPVLVATDAFKQPMFGWLIRDAFEAKGYGMDYHNLLLASGSIGVGPVLDHPAVDAIITPADYTARSVGFGWDAEGIADSWLLRGKTMLIEDDARSWATEERATQGAWRTIDECRAGLLRNLAIAASRGLFPYWMNVGRGYFDDPDVLRVVAEQAPVRQRLLTHPHLPTEHAICVILDDESPLDEDFTAGFQNLAVLRQRNDHLSMTGLPWRIHLLSDLEKDNYPTYRCYLVPNLFRLTPAKEELIRARLFRRGSVTIFGPGTAISDGSQLAADAATRLLGVPLELVSKESARRVMVYSGTHPAVAEVPPGTVYGDSFVYGPILQPAAEFDCAVELGKVSAWWYCNRSGLVLREFGLGAAGNGTPGQRGDGDYATVFSMAVPLPATLLRSLARFGGCVPWSQAGDVVAASGSMLAVHTMTPGPRRLQLPRPARVTDAISGEPLGDNLSHLDVELNAPDTRAWLLDPS